MKRSVLTGVLMVFFVCAFAQPGVLDPTFGVGGKVSIDFPGLSMLNQDIKLQPDKKMLVLSVARSNTYILDSINYHYLLSRLLPNGKPDSTFGVNGRIADSSVRAYAIALQPDGKILITGFTMDSTRDFILKRYNPNGTIDNSFGTNGQVQTSFIQTYETTDISTGVYVLPNGKILQVGYSVVGNNYCTARFNYNGSIDTTCGINGKTRSPRPLFNLDIWEPAMWVRTPFLTILDSSQRLVSIYQAGIARFKPDGNLDSSFGVNGFADYYYPNSFNGLSLSSGAIQPDGKMVIAAFYNSTSQPSSIRLVTLFRVNVDGTRDTSFKMPTLVGPPNVTDEMISKTILLPNGQTLILFRSMVIYSSTKNLNGIAKVNANGTLDSSFGINGILYTDYSLSYGAVLQPDGKLVAGGSSTNYFSTDPAIIARFENILPKNNYLKVDVYLDRNRNGAKDVDEPPFSRATATSTKTGGTGSVSATSSSGHFQLDVDTGSYTTVVTPFTPYFNIVPSSHSTSHSTYFNNDSITVGVQPIAGFKDVAINVLPLSNPLRPGWPVTYKILCTNLGNDIVSGSFKIIKDNKTIYGSSSPAPASISGDTLTWHFTNLALQDTMGVLVYLNAKTPPALNTGDTVICSVIAVPVAGESNIADNYASLVQRVIGAYDPNDKIENHGGKITKTKISSGEYLTYTVRFQNTGNDTAFNVYIRDTMDSKLDWNSLQIVASSHNYKMTMNDGRCLFTFPFIMLVDSIKNEPKSHGYIVYKIKAKPNVQIGDVIKNTAAIYFDYNLPIFTNTEMTTVVAETFPLKLLSFTARKQDKTNLLNWATAQEINVDHFEIERSKNGKDFSKIGVVSSKSAVGSTHKYSFTDYSPLTTAHSLFYRLKMIDKDGKFTYSPIRQININHSTLNIAIFPNPATDNLKIQIESDKKSSLQVLVLSGDGKLLLSNSFTASEGTTLQSINISTLPKGSYFLKVISEIGNKEEHVMKFEKL